MPPIALELSFQIHSSKKMGIDKGIHLMVGFLILRVYHHRALIWRGVNLLMSQIPLMFGQN